MPEVATRSRRCGFRGTFSLVTVQEVCLQFLLVGEAGGCFEALQTLGDGRGLGALVSLRQLVQFSLLRGFCDKAVPKLPGIFFKTFLKKFPG